MIIRNIRSSWKLNHLQIADLNLRNIFIFLIIIFSLFVFNFIDNSCETWLEILFFVTNQMKVKLWRWGFMQDFILRIIIFRLIGRSVIYIIDKRSWSISLIKKIILRRLRITLVYESTWFYKVVELSVCTIETFQYLLLSTLTFTTGCMLVRLKYFLFLLAFFNL